LIRCHISSESSF